jgi:hypothetical protein
MFACIDFTILTKSLAIASAKSGGTELPINLNISVMGAQKTKSSGKL